MGPNCRTRRTQPTGTSRFGTADGEWRLRADYHQQFVEDLTRVDFLDGL